MIANKIFIRWFAVNEYHTFEPKRRLIILQACGDMRTARLFQAIEKSGPETLAETAIGLIRRVDNTD